MSAVEIRDLHHRYRRVTALRGLDLTIPSGSVYALLGPNGAGKTTLLQILLGLLRPTSGEAVVLDRDASHLRSEDRARIGYVAEGQRLPPWMKLRELEAYLAPLYPGWDARLANDLRDRFRLNPDRRVGSLSRGERMKAALLCALAPRPSLLLMDEPFSGIDVVVRDELVRGVLESAGSDGWTMVISSHEVGELEALADWVGFLDDGELVVSEPMDELLTRFRRVEVVLGEGEPAGDRAAAAASPEWLLFERSGPRMRFISTNAGGDAVRIRAAFPSATRIDVEPATLREIFVAIARRDAAQSTTWEATDALA